MAIRWHLEVALKETDLTVSLLVRIALAAFLNAALLMLLLSSIVVYEII